MSELIEASRDGNVDLVRELISSSRTGDSRKERVGNPGYADYEGNTALIIASLLSHVGQEHVWTCKQLG